MKRLKSHCIAPFAEISVLLNFKDSTCLCAFARWVSCSLLASITITITITTIITSILIPFQLFS